MTLNQQNAQICPLDIYIKYHTENSYLLQSATDHDQGITAKQ